MDLPPPSQSTITEPPPPPYQPPPPPYQPPPPQQHMAYAADPVSSVPRTHHNHPPYAEMITVAIAALNERGGSSRQAIAKYIDQVFTDLPPTHSTMLTQNLKKMRTDGQLLMNKNSYMLPGSIPPAVSNPSPTPDVTSGLPKRRGRPPKQPKTDVHYNSDFVPNTSGPLPEPYSIGPPGFQPFDSVPGFQEPQPYSMGDSDMQTYSVGGCVPELQQAQPYSVGPEPMFVSLGLEDGPLPPPATVQAPNPPVAKRGRGRPPKLANGGISSVIGSTGTTSTAAVLGKRGRGRPPRLNGVRKGPGRPRRTGVVVVPSSGSAVVGQPKSGAAYGKRPVGRPRGRPPKIVATNGGDDDAREILPERRFGRPPKAVVANKGAEGTAVIVTDPRQLVAYQDLLTKLEHFQSKVKQVVNVIKPCLDTEVGMGAVGALHELEVLAAMDLSAPLPTQGQEQPLI